MSTTPTFTITASRIIGASASDAYRLIADYRGWIEAAGLRVDGVHATPGAGSSFILGNKPS